jgi:ribonuclease BN (tRNA processing enzyme)
LTRRYNRGVARIVFPDAVAAEVPPELELARRGFTLHGTSVAARATAFAVPELGVALDVGRLTPAIAEQPVVLISHGHMDHISGLLAYLNLRARFHPEETPRVHCPETMVAPLQQALTLMPGMEAVRRRLDLEQVIRAAMPGESVPLPGGTATAFSVDHSVPTLGWQLWGRPNRRPLVAFAADGTTAPYVAAPELLDAQVAVVECTFVEKNRRVAARMSRHAHIADWTEVAAQLTCDALVLAHLPPLTPSMLARLALPLAQALPGELVLWTDPSRPPTE